MGETLEDTVSPKLKIDAKIGALIFDQAASFPVGYSKIGSGQILGFDQEDVTAFVSVNDAFFSRIALRLKYLDTDSNKSRLD